MMKKITGLTLTAMLVVSMLAGCGANDGTVGNSTNDGRSVAERSGDVIENTGRNAGEAVREGADAAGNVVREGADTAGDMVRNGEGMIMAAGSRIQDVVMDIGEALGITMPNKLDETSLKDVFGLDPADIEEYYGEYSAVNTSADHIIGVKVKDGKVDKVRKALESRKEEVLKNFEEYLPDQYDKAQAGKIIEKGNYLFLVIAGDSNRGYDNEINRAEEIVGGYFR